MLLIQIPKFELGKTIEVQCILVSVGGCNAFKDLAPLVKEIRMPLMFKRGFVYKMKRLLQLELILKFSLMNASTIWLVN